MPRKPRINVRAQTPSRKALKPNASIAAGSALRRKMKEERKAGDTAAQTILIPDPGSNDRNQVLIERGISIVRPEIVAATEFIPLVKDTDPTDASFTMGRGDKEYRLDITNAARLVEMQLIAQQMLLKNTEEALITYAGFDMNNVMSAIKGIFNQKNSPKIELQNFEQMKNKVRSILTSSSYSVKIPSKKTGGGTVRAHTIRRSNSRMAKIFKEIDPQYADLLIEYYTRKLIVEYTNDFLSKLSSFKTETSQIFNIVKINVDSLDSSSDPQMKQMKSYITRHALTPENEPVDETISSMKDFIDDTLFMHDAVVNKNGFNSKNLLAVIKSLAADLQMEKRVKDSAAIDPDQLPIVSEQQRVTPSSYSGYNISSLFGNPSKGYNLVTKGNVKNFSKNAYARVRSVGKDNRTYIDNLIGAGPEFYFPSIESDILPFFGKTIEDLVIHSNFVNLSKNNSFKSVDVDPSNTSYNASDYVKDVLFNMDLDERQSVDQILSKRSSRKKKPLLIRELLQSFSFDTTLVMPMEGQSGKVNISKPYIPGTEYFFDQGVKKMAADTKSSGQFKDLKLFAEKYNSIVDDIIYDVSLMRGVKKSSSKSISANKLIETYNKNIAQFLTRYTKPMASMGECYFLLIMYYASRNRYIFTCLYSWFMISKYGMAIGNASSDDRFKGGEKNKIEGKHTNALSNAFVQLDVTDGEYKRPKNYAKRIGKDRQEKYEKKLSLIRYFAAEIFLYIYDEAFGIPPHSDKKLSMSDDFNYWDRVIKDRNQFYNKSAVEGQTGGTDWGGQLIYQKNILERPWKKWVRILKDDIYPMMNNLFEMENKVLKNLNPDAQKSLNRSVGIQFTNVGTQAQDEQGSTAGKRMRTNGGSQFTDPHISHGDFIALAKRDDSYGQLMLNLNRRRTYKGLNSTSETRFLGFFSYFLSIISKAAVFKVELEEKEDSLGMRYYTKAFKGATTALLGNSFKKNDMSERTFKDIRRIVAGAKSQSNGSLTSCYQHLSLLQQQARLMRQQTNKLTSFIEGGRANKIDYRHSLRFFEQSGIGSKLLSFLSPSMIASNKFAELSLMTNAKTSQHSPATDVMTYKQLQNMIKYFSQPDRGFLEQETGISLNGRKTVLHVGIPSGMIENLQYEAVAETGDGSYEVPILL